MEGLYTDTCSCVNVDGVMSDWFAVGSGVRQGCTVAPDLILGPVDHVMERTVHRGMTGVTLGKEVFTDLDFADDVSLLAEMLEVVVFALTVMQEEAIHWLKTNILQVPSSTFSLTVGRPSDTWLRAIEAALGPLNSGLATAWRKDTT